MGKRYIDAGQIRYSWQIDADGTEHDGITLQSVIDKVPTADVVEVVRCKDCKYQDDCNRQIEHSRRDYILEQYISTYNKVDYCSYGVRKEGANDEKL